MRQIFVRLLQGGIVLTLCLLAALWSLRRLSGEFGLAEVGDDEVALIYNQWTGSTREVDVPGSEVYLPFMERVLVQPRSPQRLLLHGQDREGVTLAPEIHLRTTDGSLVRFGALAVRSRLLTGQARDALEDWGADSQLCSALLEAHVRAIVQEEYGRFSSEQILLLENQRMAHAATLGRLNKALVMHAIEVIELSTPKLRFDSAYEQSVEDRKVAYQEVERLKAEFRQLEAERNQRLVALEKQKLLEASATRIQVSEYMEKIERDGRSRRMLALQYKEDRAAEATIRKYQLESEAATLRERVTLEAQVLRREVELLATTGRGLVREAWIESLAKTPIRLQPFSHDPRPESVQLIKTAFLEN